MKKDYKIFQNNRRQIYKENFKKKNFNLKKR